MIASFPWAGKLSKPFLRLTMLLLYADVYIKTVYLSGNTLNPLEKKLPEIVFIQIKLHKHIKFNRKFNLRVSTIFCYMFILVADFFKYAWRFVTTKHCRMKHKCIAISQILLDITLACVINVANINFGDWERVIFSKKNKLQRLKVKNV